MALQIDAVTSPEALRRQRRRAAEGGFDGIELVGPLPDQEEFAEDILREKDGGDGTSVECVPIIALAAKLHSCQVDDARAEVVALLNRAAHLGARCVNLAIPPLQPTHQRQGFTRYQDALNYAYDVVRRCRLDAEAVGVTMAIEVASGGCFLSPVETREFIDSVNSWAVGACLDVNRVIALGSISDWVFTLKSRVHSMRVHDSLALCAGGRAELRNAIDRADYHGPIIISSKRPPGEVREEFAELCRPER